MVSKSWRSDGKLSLRFAKEKGFFDQSRAISLAIGLFLAGCLFFLVHFREVKVETLELGTTAERYLVAQIDFQFLDQEATQLHRQEASRDIGKIFWIPSKELHSKASREEELLRKDEGWRSEVKGSTFTEMRDGLDRIEEFLRKLRFTDPRTIQKMREVESNTDSYLVLQPSEEGAFFLPSRVWKHIELSLDNADFHRETTDYWIARFQSERWSLEDDVATQTELRTSVESRVPNRYTRVSAGDRIIDQGARVTPRHMAMLQAMKKGMAERRNLWHPSTLLGSLLMTAVLMFVCFSYFRHNFPSLATSNRMLFLLGLIVLMTLGLSKVTEFLLLTTSTSLVEAVRYPLVVPLAAILLCSLFSSEIATFVTVILAVILTMTLAVERQGFLILNIAPSIYCILMVRSLSQRKEIFAVCLKAWLMCVAIIFSFHLYLNTMWSMGIVTDLITSAAFMTLTAVLGVGLLPLLESGFHILTDVALMEQMDPNREILRRLSIEAPGTYQHSLVVGNLSEAAAVAIGAHGLFCRASCLFHDIGKLTTPHYFTENQQGGLNMHQLLTPLESANVIIAHVTEGVSMARELKLPEQFIDIIKEHHGTTLTYYFYHKQLEQMGADESLVNEADFRYSGPKPRSKESAIIMIADTFEAASRSLDKVDHQLLTELIEKLVSGKAEDGQFDECDLTFHELGIVKRTMVKTLVASRHSRIKYPEPEQAEA